MKRNHAILTSFLLLVVAAALYRIVPGRPYGFAPQISMALFGGAVLKDKKWAFALPLVSLFLSDLLYQVLYVYGLTPIQGFYGGQMLNYIELSSVVVLGFWVSRINWRSIAWLSLLGPTWFFLISNFTVWLGSDGVIIPRNAAGLAETYILGLPFYQASIAATVFFNALFFGTWHLLYQRKQQAVA